jgi:hypothetical protein
MAFVEPVMGSQEGSSGCNCAIGRLSERHNSVNLGAGHHGSEFDDLQGSWWRC